MFRVSLVLLFLLGSCREKGPAPADRPPRSASTDQERENLLNIGYGATVVSRTAELTLDNSALRAIDGDELSSWTSPPSDIQQTLVFSLPAPVRVEKVGIRIPLVPPSTFHALTIEASADGQAFSTIANIRTTNSGDTEFFDAAFPNARYIRVSVIEAGRQVAALRSVHVRGTWVETPSAAPIGDCWTINEAPAGFAEREGRVAGLLDAEDAIQFDGGLQGAVYRFAWVSGPEWGYGLVTLSPDGTKLSGLKWHEEAAVHSFGGSWFGERQPCRPDGMQPDRVVETFLGSAGWYPLFSLRFDAADALVEPMSRGGLKIIENIVGRQASQRVALVAREYHGATAEVNRRRAELRLQSLRNALAKRGVDVGRIDFLPAGSSVPRRPTKTEAMRLLYGVVEIDVTGRVQQAF